MTMYNIRQKQPLIHCITNTVVTNFTANGLLAIGASPIMADEIEEMRDMVSIVDALLINIGTVNTRTRQAMIVAGQTANERDIPVVLDPVGVGATAFRKETVEQLLQNVQFQLIRCNAGELAAIANIEWRSKGVDSGEGEMNKEEVAKQVARDYQCYVIVTGETDLLTNGEQILYSSGGNELMTQITGTGCLLSAICAATLVLGGNTMQHLQQVLQQYKEVASNAAVVGLLGSFQVEVFNELYKISRSALR